jgi:predicted Fe-Mo cluster-binding NifX family protein
MKIAISADSNMIDGKIDQRFGRCKYFIIVDTEKKDKFKAVENDGALQGHGAGIKASEQIGELSVKAVITGNLGPNATKVLEKLEIRPYHSSGSIKNAIDDYIEDKLDEIKEVSEPHTKKVKDKTKKAERIFFPLLDNQGMDSEISQHFGHAPFFGIYDVEKSELKIIPNDLNHTDPNKSPIDQIEETVNPTTIFAKGIGGKAISLIAQKGLQLKTGDYTTVKEVIDNLDKLEEQNQSCGHEDH